MDTEFVERLTTPRHPDLEALFEQAREGVTTKLDEWGFDHLDPQIVDHLTYTYYHDWEQESPEQLLMIQDPGPLYNRHREDVARFAELDPEPDPCEIISLHQRFATSWLLQRNPDFTKKFLYRCAGAGLISVGEDWESYVADGAFFTDFYLTDVIKYRTDSHETTHRDASFETFLSPELEYVDPETIFVFGAPAWEAVRTHLCVEPQVDFEGDATKITEAHGYPFRARAGAYTATIIPLVHFSGQVYHSLLRDSYFAYLDEGLEALK